MTDTEVKPIWSHRRVSWFVTSYIVDCPEHGRVAAGGPREMIEKVWDRHAAEYHGDTR